MTRVALRPEPAASERGRREGHAVAREVGRGLFVLGVTGSSVGGVVSVIALAGRLLGR